jgi:hypothetical protein
MMRARPRLVVALVGAAVSITLATALVAGVGWPGGDPVRPPRAPAFSERGAALAAVYRYPLGCLSTTLSIAESAKLARIRHAGPCWRYGVFVTAILHRVAGEWRLVLEATSPSCPAVSLPPAIEAQVASCRRPGPDG